MSYPPVRDYGEAAGDGAGPRRDWGISRCLALDPALATTFRLDRRTVAGHRANCVLNDGWAARDCREPSAIVCRDQSRRGEAAQDHVSVTGFDTPDSPEDNRSPT